MAQVQVSTLLAPIAQLVPTCPIPTMVDAYIRAARRLCMEARWYRSTLIGATVVDQPHYVLGSDTYNEILGVAAVSILGADGRTVPLGEKGSTEWDTEDAHDQPENYQYVPHGQIALHPTPNAVHALTVTLVLQPKLQSNSIDDSLLVKFSEGLNDGALSYLFDLSAPGISWTDKNQAVKHLALFNAAIKGAASDVQAGYNAGAIPSGNRYGPRSAIVRGRMQVL